MDDVTRSIEYAQIPESLIFPASATTAVPLPESPTAKAPEIPAYLQETYYWCYLNPRNVKAEIQPGQSVLQSASVYGSFAPNLAAHVGPQGSLDVVDVAEVQVNSVRRKLQNFPNATVHHANIVDFSDEKFDVVCCYFLLHEVPDEFKYKVVNVLLDKVEPGGKVVFVDYHKPRWWHPLKLITSIVFDTLEPFAKGLWRNEIKAFANEPDQFSWRKEKIFGDLFQKVVATRLD